ncbi:hypothetical protein XELAEV_18003285mg [Xenopus laevis]|uniref:Uncharacterized protein n=1 Tax=Xenopus laevis TaxID=8355 RepID=A0A974BN86_XENLA|nr:hypothetical protein XELAEV_18003285mg [Xenopus laevis]
MDEAAMDELQKLEYLSLVSKVCTELDNHLGINDKDLGEELHNRLISKIAIMVLSVFARIIVYMCVI